MSIKEINYRIKCKLKIATEMAGYSFKKDAPNPDLNEESIQWIGFDYNFLPDKYLDQSEEYIFSNLTIFNRTILWNEMVNGWLCDLKSGKTAPLKFGMMIDYRNEKLVGDIKYLWEPNRHLHIVALSQAYLLSKEKKFLRYISEVLTTWHCQNVYLKGPNWTSSLELGIRLINWSIAWQLIGGSSSELFMNSEGQGLLSLWLKSVFRHAEFIRNHLSRYSSANNHLIGEAAGLFVASITWPYWDRADKWRDESYAILIKEAIVQNYSDGVNREQAIMYQQFVLDFLLIAGLAGKANQIQFPHLYWNRIESMIGFIAACMDKSGNMPMFGDADDGFVVKLSAEKGFCPYRSLLATGAVLFGRSDFKEKSKKLDHKTIWLLGSDAREKYNGLSTTQNLVKSKPSFKSGGYYILGNNFNTKKEVQCIIDCGPLGYLSIAAHGHADALSFWLSVAGEEILIDPGTFAYHTNLNWRNYFRGTSAHNTIRIDRMNQSEIGGNFMWTDKANAYCEEHEIGVDSDRFVGYHDGYKRLKDPVTHRREIILDKDMNQINVNDQLTCHGQHEVEQFWHFSEKCNVQMIDREYRVKNKYSTIRLIPAQNDCEMELVYANEELPLGWISRRYDVKAPTNTAVVKRTINCTYTLKTIIQIQMES
jgi:hypothetical protein